MKNSVSYSVVGMSCGGCANKVKNAVGSLEGVEDVQVNLGTGNVEVIFKDESAEDKVAHKIEELGYSVVK